jgi:hypothetical protein
MDKNLNTNDCNVPLTFRAVLSLIAKVNIDGNACFGTIQISNMYCLSFNGNQIPICDTKPTREGKIS